MKKLASISVLIIVTLCLALAACGNTPRATSITVAELHKYGNVVLSISGSDFLARGYEYGDVVTVTILGQDLDMPVGGSYSDVDQGNLILRIEQEEGKDRTILAINMGDFATTYRLATRETIEESPGYRWDYLVDLPIQVEIVLKEKGGYHDEWIMHQLKRTDLREDYPALTDAEFANFREVTTTGMAQGVLYRASSPVNPEIGRNHEADLSSEQAGIRTFVNLADSREEMEAFAGYADTYYATQTIINLGMAMDFAAPEFEGKFAEGVRQMIQADGPYLIHCKEGKDRTGFVCAILEALMGATREEIIADYMLTYTNYYGVEPGTTNYDTIAHSNILKTLSRAFGVEDIMAADLALSYAAEAYLQRIGLTEQEIDALKGKLS